MTEISNDLATSAYDYLWKGETITGGDRWLAFCTDSSYTEVAGDGYGRVEISALMGDFATVDGTNDTLVEIPVLDSTDPVTVTHWALMLDETTGDPATDYLIRGANQTGDVIVAAGQPLQVLVGYLVGIVDALN